MQNLPEPTQRNRPGVRKQRRLLAKIDMTPMVDLGFLLITFFIFSSRLSEPVQLPLNMHKEGPPIVLGMTPAMHVLIEGPDEIYVYYSEAANIRGRDDLQRISLSGRGGLRDLIQQRQSYLDDIGYSEGRKALMLLIKPSANASYRQVMAVLDEVLINQVERYVLLPHSEQEKGWVGDRES